MLGPTVATAQRELKKGHIYCGLECAKFVEEDERVFKAGKDNGSDKYG